MRTTARGIATTFAYDPAGRLVNRFYSTDSPVTFTYDANDNRLVMQDGTGRTTYSYDALDRKQVVTNQSSQAITYSYDALGRKSQVTPPPMSGSIHNVPTTYQYDPAGRLANVLNVSNSTFSYDAADRRVTEGVGPLVTTKAYDVADRVTGLATTNPGAAVTMTNFSYRYDNVGNRLGAIEVDGALLTWTYDSTYQLAGEARSAGSASTFTYSTTFTYDPLGNRLVKWDSSALTTSTYDAANQLETASGPAGATTFTYDLTGNLTIQNSPTGITTSTWDNENRQSGVSLPNGKVVTIKYNADGLRFRPTR